MGKINYHIVGGEEASRECPDCHSKKIWKDGFRETNNGLVQRSVCRECGYRFSSSTVLSMNRENSRSRQVCVTLQGAKNLASATETKTVAGEQNERLRDVKGKIVTLLWQLENDGRKPATVNNYRKILTKLVRDGADLTDPENTKRILAKANIKDSTKRSIAAILDVWFRFNGIIWKIPRYSAEHEIPFIPTEKELDELIAASGRIVSAYLQLMKETGARAGEISNLLWTNVDIQQRLVRIKAEKGSNSRILPLSVKAVEMLNNLPKKSERIFNSADQMRSNFYYQRRRIAKKLANPRLLQIHFHTLRHMKGSSEYRKTKDMMHVKEVLGHKSIESTQIYVHIEKAMFQSGTNDEFHIKVASSKEEITELLETGFEYILTKDGLAYFRKRK